jgi:hypothetical protein
MLSVCTSNALKFRYVLADTWYAAAETIPALQGTLELIHSQLKKNFVMPIKSNRKVALSLEDKQQGTYGSAPKVMV